MRLLKFILAVIQSSSIFLLLWGGLTMAVGRLEDDDDFYDAGKFLIYVGLVLRFLRFALRIAF